MHFLGVSLRLKGTIFLELLKFQSTYRPLGNIEDEGDKKKKEEKKKKNEKKAVVRTLKIWVSYGFRSPTLKLLG